MTSPLNVSPDLIARAMHPRLAFGRGLLAEASLAWGDALLVTMPEPWEAARSLMLRSPRHLYFVDSMDREVVERTVAALPAAGTVVGL